MGQDYVDGVHQLGLDAHSVLPSADLCELFQRLDEGLPEAEVEELGDVRVHVGGSIPGAFASGAAGLAAGGGRDLPTRLGSWKGRVAPLELYPVATSEIPDAE